MGKKGNWFTALKRAFTSSSKDKDKPIDVSEKNNIKEKKWWGFGRSKHGEINSFIPVFRKPSSIEKILCDAERDQLHRIQQAPQKKVQPFKSSAPAPAHLLAPSPKPLITLNYIQISAIKIQAAYRGYLARRNYRALKGLIRLQGVMRGQSVKRQTMNAMKCMQMLVRVQSQIRARRLQMTESRSIQQHQTPRKSDKEFESSFSSKWSIIHQSEAEAHEVWNDSVLTKEEVDTRMRRKVEAVMKRERALAYAYSHQLLNVSPKSAHAVLTDVRTGGFPWWWNYLERRLSPEPQPQTPASRPIPIPRTPITPSSSSAHHPHPRPLSRGTPRPATASKPKPSFSSSSRRSDHHPSASATAAGGLRDDDSLTSCPAFTLPNYMAPTASAKAKVRSLATDHEGKRRFSFGLGQSIGSLRWSKGGSLFAAAKDAGKHKKTLSVGGLSVDSTVSLPAGVGRRPFK